jgi:hypothetical protein
MLAYINPAAVPALTIAGIFFLVINVLAAAYIARHWQEFFGRDPRADGDRPATRALQVLVITIPLLFLTGRLILTLADLWRH